MGVLRSSLILEYLLRLAAFSIILFLNPAHALNESPQTLTLDGHLFQTGTKTPLLDSTAKVTIQIINPNGTCLLYEEQQTVNTTTTDGYFNIQVGSLTGNAKRTVNDPGRTMTQIFQNILAIAANHVSGQTCVGSSYAPVAGDIRYFRIIVTPSGTNVPDTLTPDIVMNSIPQALVAQSVQGVERAHILQVNNSGSTVLTQTNLEALFTTPAYTNLQSILAGNFMTIDSSGASLPSYAANPAGVANGDIWFDTVTNEVKYKNAAGVQVVGSGSGGITSLTVGSSMSANGTVAGTISGSGTIDLTNTGVTAGTYTKMTVDAKGRVTAGTISLVEGDIPNLTVAGKVSGNTMTSGTISGSAAINTSGNLISTGTVSGLTVQATNLRIYNGANYIQITAPTLAGIVNFTLPDTDGDANQVLTTNGSGVLSWAAGTTTLAGDVSGPSGTTSVDKIKGKAIMAGSVSGQIMIYDGIAWGNSVMSGDATLAHDGMLTLNKVPVSKGGTNATAFGNNRIVGTNITGTALQDFTCSLNQVISFDASGNAVCSNVSALSSAILNGGNSYGADISIGTNDNKAMQFKVNNTIAMTISQAGNVGIGTASPAGILDVQGGTVATGNATHINVIAQTATDAGSTGGNINIAAGTGEDIGGTVTIKAGANGVYNPASIAIGGNSWTAADISITAGDNDVNASPGKVTISSGSTANNGGGPLFLTTGSGVNAASGNIYIVPGTAGATGTGNVLLGIDWNNSARGLVGIGISTPSGILEVAGGTAANAANGTNIILRAQAAGAGNQNGGNIVLTPGAKTGTGASGGVLIGYTTQPSWLVPNSIYLAGLVYSGLGYQVNSGNSLNWGTGSAKVVGTGGSSSADSIYWSTNSIERMRLTGTGYFGIGTSNPTTALEISGALTAVGMSTAPSVSAANTGRIYFDYAAGKFKVSQSGGAYVDLVGGVASNVYVNGGNAFAGTASIGTTDNFALNIKTNNVTAMTISQSGKIGVGVSMPTEMFEVNGNIKATELILSSDQNLKRDIRPLENSLENLLRLSGVSYKWRCEEFPERNFDQLEHMGLIAQEVAKIYPHLVHGQEGNLAVDYTGLIAPIIEAIKEQNTQLRTLQSTVSKLEEEKAKQQTQLQMLLKRIEALEKK